MDSLRARLSLRCRRARGRESEPPHTRSEPASARRRYANDTQSFQRGIATSNGGTVPGDIKLEHHAVSVPLAVGVDFRVTKFLSLGPSFELAINNPVAGCATTSPAGFAGTTYCSNSEPGKNFVKAETYAVWNAGLDAKVTF